MLENPSKQDIQEYIRSLRDTEHVTASPEAIKCSTVIDELTEATHNAAVAGILPPEIKDHPESPFEEIEVVKDLLEQLED